MCMRSVAIITPTIGSEFLEQTILTVQNQTYQNFHHYIIVDGPQYESNVDEIFAHMELKETDNISVTVLPKNVGKVNGTPFFGHRVYAAFSYLVNEDYVMFLDEDNWYEPNHVESCVNTMEKGYDWCFALRNIIERDSGEFICKENADSLAHWSIRNEPNVFKNAKTGSHVDTNTYCFKPAVAMGTSQVWHNASYTNNSIGSDGADIRTSRVLVEQVKNYACTGEFTVNYRLGGGDTAMPKEFFLQCNIKAWKSVVANGMKSCIKLDNNRKAGQNVATYEIRFLPH